MGSNGSIYNDQSLSIQERATRLLIDVCSTIHHELIEVFTSKPDKYDLSKAAAVLDGFVDGFSETRFDGPTESEKAEKASGGEKSTLGITASLVPAPKIDGNIGVEKTSQNEVSTRRKSTGNEEAWIDFGFFSRTIRKVADFIGPQRLWILIDEWTTVPFDLQPYLADLLRRSMFSVRNITVKIAAIEHRARFKIDRKDESYIGFELGADVSTSINLDDYLVIDKNEQRAKEFFRTFITNHTISVAQELDISTTGISRLIHDAFTQDNVFVEFVRSTEGVPRDAMHILTAAAQKASTSAITMQDVRNAAYAFFHVEKYGAIQSNSENRAMLEWIRDEVINNRRTRAFLLPIGVDDVLINRLFDRRALHILERSRSAAHRPGERFAVYKLDYGLYIDLIQTDKFPQGLLVPDAVASDIDFDVPNDDARSYRRAILDVEKFYDNQKVKKSDVANSSA